MEALHYAHFYERRLYLTVNTLMKEKELTGESCLISLLPFYEEGLDGVIVQDVGAACPDPARISPAWRSTEALR